MLVDRVPVLSLEILQPRTQGLSSSRPLERRERERETMVWSGHMSLRKLKALGGGPCI